MTSHQPIARGLTALIPTVPATTSGERAAAQMLHLREASLPLPVIAAAAELIADRVNDPDPITRQAATAVLARLTAALEAAAG